MLLHTALYFDEIHFFFNHSWGGEILAIWEFNEQNETVRIDRWHGVRAGPPFPERPYLDQMYVALDLDACRQIDLERDPVVLPIRD